MNWDALGAIGENIGAFAVVASVIYLAVQIRKQTKEAKLAATRDLGTNYQNTLDLFIKDKELCSLWGKAVKDYLGLPEDERLRIAWLMQRITRVWEAQYLHEMQENVDSIYFHSVNQAYLEATTFPGYQQWWELSKDFFENPFRDYIDAQIIEGKKRGYTSSFAETQEAHRT